MSFSGLLIHSVKIIRNTITYSNRGEATETPSQIATAVPCLIQQRSGSWRGEQRGEVGDDDLIMFMDVRTDIRGGDIIEVLSGPEFLNPTGDSTKKFFVRSLDDAGGQGHHLEVRIGR